ncbi:MAG: hypothetical protein ACI9W1_002131 [Candidatus Azotimanducaceae bacterium]
MFGENAARWSKAPISAQIASARLINIASSMGDIDVVVLLVVLVSVVTCSAKAVFHFRV